MLPDGSHDQFLIAFFASLLMVGKVLVSKPGWLDNFCHDLKGWRPKMFFSKNCFRQKMFAVTVVITWMFVTIYVSGNKCFWR